MENLSKLFPCLRNRNEGERLILVRRSILEKCANIDDDEVDDRRGCTQTTADLRTPYPYPEVQQEASEIGIRVLNLATLATEIWRTLGGRQFTVGVLRASSDTQHIPNR